MAKVKVSKSYRIIYDLNKEVSELKSINILSKDRMRCDTHILTPKEHLMLVGIVEIYLNK